MLSIEAKGISSPMSEKKNLLHPVIIILIPLWIGCASAGMKAPVKTFNNITTSPGLKQEKIAVYAVLPFEFRDESIANYSEQAKAADSAQVMEAFETEMIRTGFAFVEREQVNRLLGEMKLQHSGFTDYGKTKEIGTMLNADAIITGQVVSFHITPKNRINLQVVIKAVSVSTGLILWKIDSTAYLENTFNDKLNFNMVLRSAMKDAVSVFIKEMKNQNR
jgi:hypothetical protein